MVDSVKSDRDSFKPGGKGGVEGRRDDWDRHGKGSEEEREGGGDGRRLGGEKRRRMRSYRRREEEEDMRGERKDQKRRGELKKKNKKDTSERELQTCTHLTPATRVRRLEAYLLHSPLMVSSKVSLSVF